MSSINEAIDDRAADWAAKRALGKLTAPEEAEFEAWLAADIRHLGAYARAEAVLARLERIHGSAIDDLRARRLPGDRPAKPVWTRRRVVLTGSIAAGLATVVVGGMSLLRGNENETFSTGLGQVREVVLSDGSVVTLNTNSTMAVHYTKERRQIRLVQGEALFDVAKNKARPFIVSAGDMQVRAVGTSFTVSLLPKRPIQVLVREGVVELKRTSTEAAAPVRVSANTEALASRDVPIVAAGVPKAKIERNTAWQYGRIALDNETLDVASREFARYSDVRIVVEPPVAGRTVTGLFVANDPVGFAKAAALVLKLKVEVSDREVRLLEKSETRD